MPDAIELLKSDHDEVRNLLDELSDTTERAGKTRQRLLEEVGEALRAHTRIEEEIFYPAVREAAEEERDEDTLRLVAEAYEEHRAAVQLVLKDLEKTEPESIAFSGRVKVLKDLIEHHIDEEEDEMFPAARELLEEEVLEELGEQMESRKEELV